MVIVGGAALCADPSLAQDDIPDGEALPALSVIPVQCNVYMIPGAGGNFAVQIIDDPEMLTERFVVSSQFKREPDDSNWNPTPCRAM